MSDSYSASVDADAIGSGYAPEDNVGGRADETGDRFGRRREHDDVEGERFGRRSTNKRIMTLLSRAKAGEARAEAAERRAAEMERVALQQGQGRLGAEDARIATELDHAQRELRAAKEAGDTDAEVKAHARLVELGVYRNAIGRDRLQIDQAVARVPGPPAQAPALSPAMEHWAAENEWFRSHPAMTEAALTFDRDARRRGIVPESPEYFAHIDRKVRAAFPEEFDERRGDDGDGGDGGSEVELDTPARAAARPPTAAAAPRRMPPANPAQQQRGPRTIRLTAEQRSIAASLNLTDQQYAAGLQNRRAKGDIR